MEQNEELTSIMVPCSSISIIPAGDNSNITLKRLSLSLRVFSISFSFFLLQRILLALKRDKSK